MRVLLFLCFATINLLGQNGQEGQKRWSNTDKLSIDDYKIKVNSINADVVYSQFMISHSISGLDLFKKNLNQKIDNIFLGNASWIDSTKTIELKKHIDFQQLQFDLAEVYARKFRKRVLLSRKQLLKGFEIVKKINNEILSEFSESRAQLTMETNGGRDDKKLL